MRMFNELIITDDEIKKLSKELDSLLDMQQYNITIDALEEAFNELISIQL